MLAVHVALGVAVIVVCVASAVLGFVAYRRRGSGGAFVSHALVLAQTLLIAQAAVGLLLLSDGRGRPRSSTTRTARSRSAWRSRPGSTRQESARSGCCGSP